MTIALQQKPLTRVVMGIVNAANGAWFDPSDLSTLYQDDAGTTPVTAVEQPVGKILDKSGNGNHATQSITASRPVLSARYNLLTYSEQFDNASWLKANSYITANAILSPFGQLTSDKLIASSTSSVHAVYKTVPTVVGIQTFSVYLKKSGYDFAAISISNNGIITAGNESIQVFDLLNGTVGNSYNTSPILATINHIGDDWYLCEIQFSIPTTSANINVFNVPTNSNPRNPFVGDDVSGVYLFGADLRAGDISGIYQRITTATDYDTNPAYFPKYLRFDGIDDYLNLPYMGLYAGGACSVVAGFQSNISTIEQELLAERNTSTTTPVALFWSRIANSINSGLFYRDDSNSSIVNIRDSTLEDTNTKILSVVDSGSNIKSRYNGALKFSANPTRSTITLNTTTIGAYVSTNTSGFLNGKLYGLIITKSALSDSQRIACERHLARKSGVLL